MLSTAYSVVEPPCDHPIHRDPVAIHKGLAGQIRFRRVRIRHTCVLWVYIERAVTNIRLAPGAETVHEQRHVSPLLERLGPSVQMRPNATTPMQRHHSRKWSWPVGSVEM